MNKLIINFLFIFFCFAITSLVYAQATPPGQPSTGYGSTENYISGTFASYEFGNIDNGTQLFYYIPDTLKNGTSAPAVIFLHGMFATAPPFPASGYNDHITHLLRQGYVVIYPQFNTDSDLDQYVMLDRCVSSTHVALAAIGSQAETDNLVLYGHSVGGIFCICWGGAGGVPVKALVTAQGNMDPCGSGMPDWACALITKLDYVAMAPAMTCPAILLWGDADISFASWNQQYEAFTSLTNASSKVIYTAQSDYYGDPDLVGHHGAPNPPVDALDYRYYWAALDAALDNQTLISFDMGEWSDGTPVKPVLENLNPSAECSIDVSFCAEPCEMNISLASFTCDGTPATVAISDPDCDGITGECTSLPDGCITTYIDNICDNCPDVFNPGQQDSDRDGVGDACETTLISLASFRARPASGKVTITWATASEIENAGFNLYRAESKGGEYVQINDALIPTEGSPASGAVYEFVDDNVKNRKTYWYRLKDVDSNGVSTSHGPVLATPRFIYGR